MKTWKQKTLSLKTFVAIIAFWGIMVCFTACPPDDNGNTSHTHNFGTEWKSDATQHWHECSCGEKTAIASHVWGNWIQTIPPSIDEAGEETKTCSVCLKTEKQPVAQLIACTCVAKAHLGIGENCNCGGNSCNCTLQEYGELYHPSGIKIHRTGALSEFAKTEMEADLIIATAAQNARDAFNGIEGEYKINFESKVNKVYIFPTGDSEYSIYGATSFYVKKGEEYIFGFRASRVINQISTYLSNIARGDLTPTIIEEFEVAKLREVWDSSIPSKQIGTFCNVPSIDTITVLLNSSYAVNFNMTTGEQSASPIYFTDGNQTGDPIQYGSNNNMVYYNRHNSGTYYQFKTPHEQIPPTEGGSNVRYNSAYGAQGNALSGGYLIGNVYKLETIDDPFVIGIPSGITGPLIVRIIP